MRNKLIVGAMITAGSLIIPGQGFAQYVKVNETDSIQERYFNWFNMSPSADNMQGVATEQTYQELLKGKKPRKKIRVAVIDSGIDVEHEDLKAKIWTNEKEIPGNGIDDDENGYVDDIHGWNFIADSEGNNVVHETLEVTRLYRKLKPKYDGKTADQIADADQAEFELYQTVKEEFETESGQLQGQYRQIAQLAEQFKAADEALRTATGKESYTLEDLKNLETSNPQTMQMRDMIMSMMERGTTLERIEGYRDYLAARMNYHFNLDLVTRPNYDEQVSTPYYGNNDVIAEEADHGTHVAGIIGAVRGNDLGMDGVADYIEIMAVRAVPDGDERDEDVANAIRYAVDNGADVINMSFGKSFSPNKPMVDDAIRYAEEKGVLLVHAAGNDSNNLDEKVNFPTDKLNGTKKRPSNFITVGASSIDAEGHFAAPFSNYGKKSVDVFAPGTNIFSTVPGSRYRNMQGTSMAAPVVSGVAALLLSYYPEMTPADVKKILIKSGSKYKKVETILPGTGGEEAEMIQFSKLSSGKVVVNVYEAFKLAEKKYGVIGTQEG
ncbi:S8 family peptidase [Pontibacter sp. G13]|uniref:S8 family peptidase n=1 Tax=Pontibacter sp. G13 TaxID=3074898 RepID=UPI00288BA1B9|nr:S8 family peptidase [Pontibacter sp. G13]WNJ20979.1 S8 family peptidase [Pontibacter sp. G13]